MKKVSAVIGVMFITLFIAYFFNEKELNEIEFRNNFSRVFCEENNFTNYKIVKDSEQYFINCYNGYDKLGMEKDLKIYPVNWNKIKEDGRN